MGDAEIDGLPLKLVDSFQAVALEEIASHGTKDTIDFDVAGLGRRETQLFVKAGADPPELGIPLLVLLFYRLQVARGGMWLESTAGDVYFAFSFLFRSIGVLLLPFVSEPDDLSTAVPLSFWIRWFSRERGEGGRRLGVEMERRGEGGERVPEGDELGHVYDVGTFREGLILWEKLNCFFIKLNRLRNHY